MGSSAAPGSDTEETVESHTERLAPMGKRALSAAGGPGLDDLSCLKKQTGEERHFGDDRQSVE